MGPVPSLCTKRTNVLCDDEHFLLYQVTTYDLKDFTLIDVQFGVFCQTHYKPSLSILYMTRYNT